jgi:hypothetical protein
LRAAAAVVTSIAWQPRWHAAIVARERVVCQRRCRRNQRMARAAIGVPPPPALAVPPTTTDTPSNGGNWTSHHNWFAFRGSGPTRRFLPSCAPANPHVQFDEREVETGLLFAGTAPPLDSALRKCLNLFRFPHDPPRSKKPVPELHHSTGQPRWLGNFWLLGRTYRGDGV